MSDELNLGISIEFMLRQIDQALNANDIVTAEKLLADVKGRARPGTPEQLEVQRQERDLQAHRNARVASSENTIRQLLTQNPMPFNELENEIDQLQRLQPDHASLNAWRNQLVQHRREKRTQDQIDQLTADLTRMWREAEETEKAGLIARPLIALYEQARDYAQREASGIGHPRADALVQQAERRLMEVRLTHYDRPSKVASGHFRDLYETYSKMDPAATVPVALDYNNFEQTLKPMPAGEALELIGRQAREFAAEKAREYRENAMRQLENHAPGPADEWLRKALDDLYKLDEEERVKVVNMRATQVKPALNARQSAELKLKEAEVQGDPQRAWELFVAARNADPYTPNLDDVKAKIVSRVKTRMQDQLDQAGQKLANSDSPDFESALRILPPVQKLAGEDVEFKTQLDDANALFIEAETWQRLEKEIRAVISDAETKKETQPRVAYEGLLARMAGWGERAKRFRVLKDVIAQLEARVNVTDLVARANRTIQDASITTVQEALHACDIAITENQPSQGEVAAVRRRLDLHLKYLQGAFLLQNTTRTSGDEQSGLKLLQEVIDNKGDDLQEAQKLANTIRQDRKAEAAAATALALGMQRLNEKRYEEAYGLLKPHAARAEFAEPLAQATAAWEVQLLERIQSALSASRIDETQAMKWVDALTKLGSEHATGFRARVTGRSAAQRARDLEQLPNKNWADILTAWNQAIAAEPTNPPYQAAQQNADKQKAYSDINALTLERQATELESLVKRYPADLEVRLRLIDTLVRHIGELRKLDEIETSEARVQKLVAEVRQMTSGEGSAHRIESQLDEQANTAQIALDIARRKYNIEQQLKPELLLDSWKQAKKQADEFQKDYSNRRDVARWARDTLSGALQGAQERLKTKITAGADVWDKVQPAAQVLILNEANVEARQQIEAAYQAVTVLDAKLTAQEGDKVGAAYTGDARQSLINQLDDANRLRAKLIVAEQVLTLFGGFFRDSEGLRNQVKGLQARNNQLIEQLEQLQRYLAGMKAAMQSAQADDSDSAWLPVDEQRNLIDKLGYSRHRAVLAMDDEKRQIQQKQRYLRGKRQEIAQAVEVGNASEALRLAALMRRKGDPLADPDDDYAEQRRFRVTEPYIRRVLTRLDDIVDLLMEQQKQVEQLRGWLPVLPETGATADSSSPPTARANRPLVRWEQVRPRVDDMKDEGSFDLARRLIEQALEGEVGPQGTPSGKLRGEMALNPAIGWLSKPVIAESELKSKEARRLWDYGRQLFKEIQSDRDAALQKRGEVDRKENEWQDAWQRFMGAVSVVDFELQRPLFERLWPGWGNKLVSYKQTARMEYNVCKSICPNHPDLVGWDNNPMLG